MGLGFLLFGPKKKQEKAEAAKAVPAPDVDQVLLVLSGLKNSDSKGTHLSTYYVCSNLPGYAVTDDDLDGYKEIDKLGVKPEVLTAITKMLQEREWQGWYFKCALRDGKKKFDQSQFAAERIILARKKSNNKADDKIFVDTKENYAVKGSAQVPPPSYASTS